uniref:Uncharacterized protein n=1 Tax=Fervidobacterium thailandense TaxID=1008305 RepID=A0A7C5RIM7_9BACT
MINSMVKIFKICRELLNKVKRVFSELTKRTSKSKYAGKTITIAIIHFDGQKFDELVRMYKEELKAASIIVGKNIPQELIKEYKNLFRSKDMAFVGKEVLIKGTNVEYAKEFHVNKLRSFEKRKLHILVTEDKKIAWMISQMFPFYCVCPGEPFEETVITAPIPLTKNSDGYYFSKVPYRNQVTLIDLNIDIIRDFSK